MRDRLQPQRQRAGQFLGGTRPLIRKTLNALTLKERDRRLARSYAP